MESRCSWFFKLLRLDEEKEKEVLLCSNGYTGGKPLENINVRNFTLKSIRTWLFAATASVSVLSDFDLLKLLFASCGSAEFHTICGDVRYSWDPSSDKKKEEILANKHIDAESVSWLEYQARRASRALRPLDQYYKP